MANILIIPKGWKSKNCVSEAGCIIEPNDIPDAKVAPGYKSKNLPIQKYIISEFPYKGKLSYYSV
jgi:hypothetical protein